MGKYVETFADPEDFSEELKGHWILFPQVIEQVVDEIFLLGAEDVGKDLSVIVADDLNKKMAYVAGESEGVVIEVGEEDALADVLEAIGDDGKIEKLLVFEGDDGDEFGAVAHEVPMLGRRILEVGVV